MSDTDKLVTLNALIHGALDGQWPDSSTLPASVNLFIAQARPLIESDQKRYAAAKTPRKGEGEFKGVGDCVRCEGLGDGGGDSVGVLPSVGGVESNADDLEGRKGKFLERIRHEAPTRQNVFDLSRVLGLEGKTGDEFYDYFSRHNWTDTGGKPVGDWTKLFSKWTAQQPRRPVGNILTKAGQLLPIGLPLTEFENLQGWLVSHAPKLAGISPETYMEIRGHVCVNSMPAVTKVFKKLAAENFEDLPNILARVRELRETDEEISKLVRFGN